MEKLVYALWRDPRHKLDDFCQRIRNEIAPQLVECGAHGVVVNVVDEAVRGGNSPFIRSCAPQMEAFVMLWLDSANQAWRQPYEDIIKSLGGRFAAYVVSESQPLRNERCVVPVGERTPGFVQVALFQRPPRVQRDAWLDTWLGSHTRIAIDTQDTFLYVQNVVGRALHFDAPRYDAIVEEGFPLAALTDPQAFYDAVGDADRHQHHEQLMMESCARFIDGDKLDVMPTSQYVIKPVGA